MFEYAIEVLKIEKDQFYINNEIDKQLQQAIEILKKEGGK